MVWHCWRSFISGKSGINSESGLCRYGYVGNSRAGNIRVKEPVFFWFAYRPLLPNYDCLGALWMATSLY